MLTETVKDVVTLIRALHESPYVASRHVADSQSTQYRAAAAAVRVINLERQIDNAKSEARDNGDAQLALAAVKAELLARHCRALLDDIDQLVVDNASDDGE